MTDDAKKARTLSEQCISAATVLTLLWFGMFLCGVACIVFIRVLMWVWQHMELQ